MKDSMQTLYADLADLTEVLYKDDHLSQKLSDFLELVNLFIDNDYCPSAEKIDKFVVEQVGLE